MKKYLYKTLTSILVATFPMVAGAQWGMVRFDEINYFTKIETITPDAAVSFGFLQNANSFIMRTNDGGATWDSLDLVVSGNEYQIGSVDFVDVQNGYAGGLKNGLQGLVKTNDNGATWSDVTPDPSIALQINGISFIDDQNGFAADQTKIYRTNNGGINWVNFTPGLSIEDISFATLDVGYACGMQNSQAAVMKTVDGGQTWNTVVTANLPFMPTSSMQKADAVNQDVVFVSGQYSNLLFKSLNGGASWDTITISQISELIDFDFTSENYGQIISGMGEIYSTNDGGVTWVLEYSVATGAYGPSVFLTSISFYGTTGYVCGTNGLIKRFEVPTGIYEVNSGKLNIYPSPVSRNQTVKIENIKGDFIVELYSVSGALIKQQLNSNEIGVDNISPGIYTVKVSTLNSVELGKLVVIE